MPRTMHNVHLVTMFEFTGQSTKAVAAAAKSSPEDLGEAMKKCASMSYCFVLSFIHFLCMLICSVFVTFRCHHQGCCSCHCFGCQH